MTTGYSEAIKALSLIARKHLMSSTGLVRVLKVQREIKFCYENMTN